MDHAAAFQWLPRRELRLRPMSCRLTWLFVAPLLEADDARPLKVRATAEALGLRPRAVRQAFGALVSVGLLERMSPPTTGAPGTYRLGPQIRAAAGCMGNGHHRR